MPESGRGMRWKAQSLMKRRGAPPRILQRVAQLFERRPSRIELEVGMLVRLHVQVFPTHGAETGALGRAEDLLRQRESDRVAHPRADIEGVVRDVVGAKAVGRIRTAVVELAGRDVGVDLCMPETAHARPGEARAKAQVEDRRARRLRDRDRDRNGGGEDLVALAGEDERLELDVERQVLRRAGSKPQAVEVDRVHAPGG